MRCGLHDGNALSLQLLMGGMAFQIDTTGKENAYQA